MRTAKHSSLAWEASAFRIASPLVSYRVRARVWRYPGSGGWHFANLSVRQSADVRKRFGDGAKAWGSIPVRVRIGKTEWTTSIFPDTKSKSYLFAIKAQVRKKESIKSGDTISAVVRPRGVS